MKPLSLNLLIEKLCRGLFVLFALLLSQNLCASVRYDFNPLTMYEDESRPNNEQYFVCAFDGMFLEFPEDVYVNDSKISDIKIFSNGLEVESWLSPFSLELVNNNSSTDLVLRIETYGYVLCGAPGTPCYYSVVFPQGLFGNKEWRDSNYAGGRANPEIKYDTQGYGEPYPTIPDMQPGEYTLHIPSTGLSLYFEHKDYCPVGPDYIQYVATAERLDNKGFYIEYRQPMEYDVSGGYLFGKPDNDGFEYRNADGSFAFFDYLRTGDIGDRLLFIGDYDYLENVEITIECSSVLTFSLRIVGVGKYNEPDTPPVIDPAKVTLSIVLPGGCVTQRIPRDTDTEFHILPDNGWTINTCSVADEDVSSKISDDGLLLINISEDASLSAVFQKDDSGIAAQPRNAIKVYTRHGGIEIVGKPFGEVVMIYRPDGTGVYSGNESAIDLPAGLYMAKISSATFKFMVH